MNFKDVEILSEYLDGQLDPDILARIESRLSKDAELRSVLEDLRSSRDLMRRLPIHKPKRDFRLTRAMVSKDPPLPAAFNGFRLAAVMASLLFAVTVSANLLSAPLMQLAAAPQQAIGMGGGGGGPESFAQEAPAPEEAQPLAPSLGLEPLPTAELFAEDSTRIAVTPEYKSSAPTGEVSGSGQIQSVTLWLFLFGLTAIVCALAAFFLRTLTIARWRKG